MDPKGKKIVITGASSGYGKRLTEIFLEKGASILAVARNTSKMETEHPNLKKVECDISSKEGVDTLFEIIKKDFQNPDIFFANAGFGYHEKIEKPDWAHISKIYETNVFSPIYSLEKMQELKGKEPFRFLVTISGVAYFPIPGLALYTSTKAAIHNFTSAFSFELEKGQMIQTIYPVGMVTPFFSNKDEPLPTLVQDLERASQKTIKGILKDKKKIYPSNRFIFSLSLSLLSEKIAIKFQKKENKIFKEWWNNRK
ncbi:MAG: SDR family NAD(P)-dependent oxidoreductase [Spirochaetales bacterium]|nr:SDR family NAD(P)-dependent oxidoreductase [Spirochaetales bacterium]